jgi:hypothetical protein
MAAYSSNWMWSEACEMLARAAYTLDATMPASLRADEVLGSETASIGSPRHWFYCTIHRFISSLASAFFTSDWEIRNCRAIRDGAKPALKAARIAFSFP